jgi:Tfp pilus assembly protein PilF
LGKAYYYARDYASAITWLAKIPKDDAGSNEAEFYLGLSAFYADQMDKAEAAFRVLSSRLPLTEVFNNLGVVAARRGQRKGARAYFERSVQADANDPDYHFNLAVELYREGDAQGAARELRAALAIRNDAEARTFLDAVNSGAQSLPRLPLERIKRNYNESGFRQLALEIANADELRLQKAPPAQHAAFHVQRGQELLEQSVMVEAEKQFREAVKLDPSNAAAHAGLARVLEASQDRSGARKEAQAALRIKPLPDAYLVLARLELAEDNRAAAEQNLNQALALDPANPAAIGLKNDLASAKARSPQP